MFKHKIMSLYLASPLELLFDDGIVCTIPRYHPIVHAPYFQQLLNAGYNDSNGTIDFKGNSIITTEIWDILCRLQATPFVFSCKLNEDETQVMVVEETLQIELDDSKFSDVLAGAQYFGIDISPWVTTLCKEANTLFLTKDPKADNDYDTPKANLLYQFVTDYTYRVGVPLDLVVAAFPNLENITIGPYDVTDVKTPTHWGRIKNLTLFEITIIPSGLVEKAIEEGVEDINLPFCDLSTLKVPKQWGRIKTLNISTAKNIPVGFIEKALEEGVDKIVLYKCDLSRFTVPEKWGRIKSLFFFRTENIPVGFIEKALEEGVEHLDLCFCDLRELEVPEKVGRIKKLNLYGAKNIPITLEERVREVGGVVHK